MRVETIGAATLTRKDQVLEVLKADGWATTEIKDVGFGIACLFDKDGNNVPAWQTAITSNLPKCRVLCRQGKTNHWFLKP